MIQELLPQAERIAAKLKARGETIGIAESSTAGMISAALLAVPGASAYFMGGAVVSTRVSRADAGDPPVARPSRVAVRAQDQGGAGSALALGRARHGGAARQPLRPQCR